MAYLQLKQTMQKNCPDWYDNFDEWQISSSILMSSREINIVKYTLEYNNSLL
jgi:hypothetical protein